MMSEKNKCSIFFQMKIETEISDLAYISGNIPELGNWDPYQSLRLETNESKYPIWTTPKPLVLDYGTKFQFKCVIMEGDKLRRWETLPNDLNRRYRAKYHIVTLKGTESKVEGSEVVEQSTNVESSKKKDDLMKKVEENIKEDMDKSLFLDENTIYKKRKLNDNFNPFSFDEESESEGGGDMSSSFISLEHQDSQEIIADKFEKHNKKTIQQDSIEEISSPKSPNLNLVENEDDLLEEPNKKLKKAKPCENLNNEKKLHLHEIFQQIKDKTRQVTNYRHHEQRESLDEMGEIFCELNKSDSIIIVSRFLPLRVKKNLSNEWEVISNDEISILSLVNTIYEDASKNYQNIIFVGWLKDEIPVEDRDEVEAFLLKHKCLPVFIDAKQQHIFANYFKHDEISMIDLVTHNYYIGKESLGHTWIQRNIYWDIWVSMNRQYANKILNVMKETSMVLICEYNLILVPTYLMREFSKPLIAQYFNINFPSFENFRVVPYKDEILNGLLSSSIICFNDYEHINQFFTTLNILKGVEYECSRGLTYLKYMGRKIYVKFKLPTIDPDYIESLRRQEDYFKPCGKSIYFNCGCNLVIGVDPPSELSALERKFGLFFQYVKENKNKYNLKLIQYLVRNPYNSLFHSEIKSEYMKKLCDLQNRFNNEYMELVRSQNFPLISQNELIKIQDFDITEKEFILQLTRAKIYLKTSIKSMNYLDITSFVATNRNFGYALISEFITLHKGCETILRFNPLKYSEFKERMNYILNAKKDFTALLQATDLNIFKKMTISNWFEGLLQDLKCIGEGLKKAKLENIENNDKNDNLLSTKMRIMNESFQNLPLDKILSDYKKAQNRLILLDYEGTLVQYDNYTCITRNFAKNSNKFHLVSLHPSESLVKDILFLAQDPDNSLYIITGNKIEYLDYWFGHLLNVGLAAEYGFFYKNKGKTKWGHLFSMDWSWKEIVKKIFELYKKNTEGSEIESKDSCMVWKYHRVQQDFAKKQANELISHLKSSLEYFKQIEIFQGTNYIEVRPKHINKGTMAEILMTRWLYEKKKIDFILCIGDGLSDEEMFISIKNRIKERPCDFPENFEPYNCVVGKKPSHASYYVNNVNEVLNLVHMLKEASDFN